MKKLIAGNWKMNGSLDDARFLIADIVNGIHGRQELLETCEFVVCPPFVHIPSVRHALHNTTYVAFGGQDCSSFDDGAYTGDVSAAMLKDIGASYVILGHSERRQYHGETDSIVSQKAQRAHKHGLVTIICVGESDEQRELGQQEDVVAAQLEGSIPACATAQNTVIAYEPVWAIGTGKTATPDDVRSMHAFIRKKIKEKVADSEKLRILYGGSMKPDNAAELLATENVDGGLIGGASLKADQFLGIAKNA
jgi:triosephosphate isomerase